ncbi:hypothetical protein CJ179_38260 [Rhodococcus sp. ACS1]|uniref:DUF2637 domain-containing protein n=1 Tax=Rhodococcus sp. ACS1 TaxID=2028570 RepID=UPI000BB1159F|nr:DUF2637 domain-containing protein [Rhodococcus sp. ACS1]PBC38452.1 hypothetical protein CJ179_38260 [Rhodococcus sp. ACS1]
MTIIASPAPMTAPKSGFMDKMATVFQRDRYDALTVATGTSIVMSALAFSISFTSLTDLAMDKGLYGWQAWMWPVIVDGLTIVSTLATSALKGKKVAFSWFLLLLGTVISVAANSVHADINGHGPIGIAIGASVPILLLLILHQTILMRRQKRANEAAEVAPAEVPEVAAPAPVVAPQPQVEAQTIMVAPIHAVTEQQIPVNA